MENNKLDVTTHAGVARQMAQTLAKYGLDAQQMFRDVGLDPGAIGTADARVASVRMQQLWRNAVEATGDEAFGLAYAETMHPAVLEGLGFAWIASSTLRDGPVPWLARVAMLTVPVAEPVWSRMIVSTYP